MFRRVRLSIIRSLFTVHSAMVRVIQVCIQLSSRSICICEWRQHNLGDIPVCNLGTIWLRWTAIWPDMWPTVSLKQQQSVWHQGPKLQIRTSTFIYSSISSSFREALSSEGRIRENLQVRDRGLLATDIPIAYCSNCRKLQETSNRIAGGQLTLPTDKVNYITQ